MIQYIYPISTSMLCVQNKSCRIIPCEPPARRMAFTPWRPKARAVRPGVSCWRRGGKGIGPEPWEFYHGNMEE
jgi:hypothetical protein